MSKLLLLFVALAICGEAESSQFHIFYGYRNYSTWAYAPKVSGPSVHAYSGRVPLAKTEAEKTRLIQVIVKELAAKKLAETKP